MNYPVLIHCESGRKALLEDEDGTLSYWARWNTIWVEVDSPLLAYKPDGRKLCVDR